MGFDTHFEGGNAMDKKLSRLFWPGLWVYFAVVAGFVLAAALTGNYILAAVEAAVTVALLIYYILIRNRRHKEIQSYVKTSFRTGAAETPFPMVLFRLGDNSVLWTNDRFGAITGYQEKYMQQPLGRFLPDIPTDWLAAGKNEYPYDVTLGGRRYRIYGTTFKANDAEGSVLGMLYFSDLTELYQVRDEYIRSRPVTAIVLVDNYEELTKNLPEGDISGLNARINDVIAQWSEDYHG